jgi:hypothetical protein
MNLHIEKRGHGWAVTRYDASAGRLCGVTVHFSPQHQPATCAALAELAETITTITEKREAQLHAVIGRALTAKRQRQQRATSEAA